MGLRCLLPVLPAALPFVNVILLVAPYTKGVASGELIPFPTTISTAGACPSAAALFTYLICLDAVVQAGCTLVLHRLLVVRGESARVCRAVLFLGIMSATAIAIIGFISVKEHRRNHFVALGVLISGYACTVVLLTYLTPHTQIRLRRFRLAIVAIAVTLAVSTLTIKLVQPRGYFAEMEKFDGACNASEAFRLGWSPGTWKLHSEIVFAISEWTLIMLQGVFVASFVGEIRRRLGKSAVLYTPLAMHAEESDASRCGE